MKKKQEKERSRERLSKNCKKKIQTTMIGSLSSIEEYLGHLWGHGQEGELTDEQEDLRLVYEELRSEILRKGNTQIRNVDSEMSEYDIQWNRYQYQIPVKPL